MRSSAGGETRPSLPIRLLPAAVAVGLVALALWALGGGSLPLVQVGGGTGPRVGAVAPDFTLNGSDGRPVTLRELRGKKVVLNFWATWCPPCRAEMPDIDRVAREYADRGVVVLAIDQLESTERVTGYLKEIGLDSPALVPVYDLDGSVGQAYRVNALPSTFVLDGDGVIRDVHLGPVAEGTLRAKVERVR